MKLLHTGDWHLGHSFFGYDRMDEQREMVESIAATVEKEQPDLMLVCGDIFDTTQPSAQAQRLWADALIRFRQLAPQMDIVAISGNHDSASRHEIFRIPWQILGVHMVGNIYRDSGFDDLIVELPDKCFVAAVPFAYRRNMPEDIYVGLLEEIDSRNRNGLPVLIAAHATVCGSLADGHEYEHASGTRMEIIGGVEAVGLDCFGKGYDYLALGHIHRPQIIAGGNGRAYYAGSPISMSFDETFIHSVNIAEITHGLEPLVRSVEVKQKRILMNIPEKGFASWPQVKEMVARLPRDTDAYLRLNVDLDEQLPPAASMEAALLCEDKNVRFCCINIRRDKSRGGDACKMQGFKIDEFRKLTPLEIASDYASECGVPFDESLKELFNEVAITCLDNDEE